MTITTDLDQLLEAFADPHATDLVINGPEDVQVFTLGGWQAKQPRLTTGNRLDELAVVMVSLANRHLDLANPMVDVTLGAAECPKLADLGVERLRVHAVLGGTVSPHTLVSLRAHRIRSAQSLASAVTGFENGGGFLGRLRQVAESGESFLISGPPGSGKTTLLRAMLSVQPTLRTVVIEDTAELLPINGHFVGLQARQANTEQRGELGLDRLLRESLRMNPERIVVGEVRGAEAKILLEAIGLAGIGGAGTIHATAASQVGRRLELLSGQPGALNQFQWQVHLRRTNTGRAIDSIRSVAHE